MRSPTPAEVIAARKQAGLTQEQSAALIYKDVSAGRRWETDKSKSSARDMDPALFELFMIKTGQDIKNVI